jgi:uncharacterized protein Yka (UPF0111/DUF47 family)
MAKNKPITHTLLANTLSNVEGITREIHKHRQEIDKKNASIEATKMKLSRLLEEVNSLESEVD